MPTKRTKTRTPASLSLFPVTQDRDPEVLDVQATARMLGISPMRLSYFRTSTVGWP